MLQLKSFALLTCLLALSLGTVPVCAQAPADVGFIALDPEDPGKKPYLAALALHHGEKYVAALAAAEGVITNHPKSKWFRKARFLKAETLVALRRYEAAETIYAEEAQRLLGEERKHEIAGVLTRFADILATAPEPNDLDARPADYPKAHKLYGKVLAMEIGRGLRDEVSYKAARAIRLAGNHNQAIKEFRAYLAGFDPQWTGSVGSAGRIAGRRRENPPPAGEYVWQARYDLALAQLAANQRAVARVNLEDLIGLIAEVAGQENLVVDARWQIVTSYQLVAEQGPGADRGVAAAQNFLGLHRDDPRAVVAAWWIAESFRVRGRSDDAVKAYEDLIAGRPYSLPGGEAAGTRLKDFGASPRELEDRWRKLSTHRIGEIRFAQKKYQEAITVWKRYVNRFPSGPQWSQAQHGIVNAEYHIGLEAVAARNYDEARRIFSDFLVRRPLDGRARQILFVLGQIRFAEARALEKKKADAAAITQAWRSTVEEWMKLVTKYPNTDESSLALYRCGVIQEEKLGDLDGALASYRKLNWGSWAPQAQARVAVMTAKQLTVKTERKFRTTEEPRIKLAVRNVKKLTLSRYFLELEAFFRKTHGTARVEDLDIALIQPDKTWEIEIGDYADYKPIEQEVGIAFPEGASGVCLVNVSTEEFEATTLILRSDLDLIVKSSRRELLVFAQDMVKKAPAAGVDLLVSDGSRVFKTGKTGKDGVWRAKDEALAEIKDLRVFGARDGHVASNVLGLSGLQLSRGLSARGYVYTDRPVYLPGQPVNVRGILREVKDGSYVPPEGRSFILGVLDSMGRLVWQGERETTDFGTFTAEFPLDADAPVGAYRVTVRQKDAKREFCAGSFQVQQFQLAKMRLEVKVPEKVYFRGDIIRYEIVASYYWGEPIADRPVRTTLPDGRSMVVRTDKEGRVRVTFDTRGSQAGSFLSFHAGLMGENVGQGHTLVLARSGFNAEVSTARELVLSGEPFEVTIKTTTPDGKPVTKEMTLTVLHRKKSLPDPVLTRVPWVPTTPALGAEVTVSEHRVTTDPKTGEARVPLDLEAGGSYVLRATGPDRFGAVVTAQGAVAVSDEDDATRLRIFSERETLKVGEEVAVRLHSRLPEGLALLTVDGEEIISHQVIPIRPGFNEISLKVGHEHFPNIRIAVAALDDRVLRVADRPFMVSRKLRVEVKPVAESYLPGAQGEVELVVTDQLGNPVKAELSLSLVDRALYALYPEIAPAILDFFQDGVTRYAEFRYAASNGFHHNAATAAVASAVREESSRVARENEQIRELESLSRSLSGLEDNLRLGFLEVEPQEEAEFEDGAAKGNIYGGRFGRAVGGGKAGGAPASPGSPRRSRRSLDKSQYFFGTAVDSISTLGAGGVGSPRRELPAAGAWLGSVVTDAEGRARVTLDLPEKTTAWRLTARGTTVETLVGEATSTVMTRKDFFVDIKAPAALMEGDQVRVLARVHNLSDNGGDCDLVLGIFGGSGFSNKIAERRLSVALNRQGMAEALFDPVTVPGQGDLRFEVSATAGERSDALSRRVPVRAWGLEYADHDGGTASGDTGVSLELPGGRAYGTHWLTVSVGPSVRRAVLEMALNGAGAQTDLCRSPRFGGHAGSDLLAVTAAMRYAQKAGSETGDFARIVSRARALLAGLVVSQNKDGGWSWTRRSARSDLGVTATVFWAICEARELGFGVEENTIKRAQDHLLATFRKLAAGDNDGKAAVLHALSLNGAADFALLNRLYRGRNSLSNPALALTALACARLERLELSRELVAVLTAKGRTVQRGGSKRSSWSGSDGDHRYFGDELESTALTLLAMLQVQPDSDKVREAVAFLMSRGTGGFTPAKAHGPAVAALADWFGRGQYATDEYSVAVLVNGTEVQKISSRGTPALTSLRVPGDLVKSGKNLVEFRLDGRGDYTYAATLRGFSPELTDPESWQGPYVKRRSYHHDELSYRDQGIGVMSTSAVRNIEIGQKVRVNVEIWLDAPSKRYLVVEEHLPAGMIFVQGSLKGGHAYFEVADGRLVMYFPPEHKVRNFSYELVGFATGESRVLPTVIRDALRPGDMRIGSAADLTVLAPGGSSDDVYATNNPEHFKLGSLNFRDRRYREALSHLGILAKLKNYHRERDVARMLLWIHTSEGFYDADRIVKSFEVLRERYPELAIPFDKILAVGRAYRDIGEHERAWLVYRATIDASFINDANVSAVLEDEGQFLGSIDYQQELWSDYPDTASVVAAYFTISQSLYEMSPNAEAIAKRERSLARNGEAPQRVPDEVSMLREATRILESFMVLYPKSPIADDAAFSMANAMLALKQYKLVVSLCSAYQERFPESEFNSGFQYMEALGHFWQHNHREALVAAKVVGEGESKDRDFARYIVGQIYHAEGSPADAITWYQKVKEQYPDARAAIDYFEEKRISMEEISILRPGGKVELKIKYRNVKDVALQVYRVDLMKLYLREKNLNKITQVHLAGIRPELERTLNLGDGLDYMDKERTVGLKLKDEAAYLVICRGDDLFTSGLVLITPLKIEVQEETASGRLRVNVIDEKTSGYAGEVHVKAIGSADGEFKSGDTDLRGIFVADNLRGRATVIARAGESRYAFHRGESWLGAPANDRGRGGVAPQKQGQADKKKEQLDYKLNLKNQNFQLQQFWNRGFDDLRRKQQRGVQVQETK